MQFMRGPSWRREGIAAIAALACALTHQAQAGFFNDFESYKPGTSIGGLDGWSGWDKNAAVAGIVTDRISASGSNSLQIGERPTDSVLEFKRLESGAWSLSARLFLASGQRGSTYFILMSDYVAERNADPKQWGLQLRFDLDNGVVGDDLRGGKVALQFDRWADIRVDLDLDSGSVVSWYNGEAIAKGAWDWAASGSRSAQTFNAINLYTAGDNVAFYDDVELLQVGGSAASPVVVIPSTGATSMLALGCVLTGGRRRWGGRG